MRKTGILFLLILLCACSVKQPLSIPERYLQMRSGLAKIPSVYPIQDARNDQHLVNLSVAPFAYNQSVLKSFMDKIKQGISAQLTVVSYTDEGDPVLTVVQYTGEFFLAVVDTSRDKFSHGGIEEFKFAKLIPFSEGGRNTYHLFNTDVTLQEYMKSMLSSNSADWIDTLYICHD
jgi:hypothetical protein